MERGRRGREGGREGGRQGGREGRREGEKPEKILTEGEIKILQNRLWPSTSAHARTHKRKRTHTLSKGSGFRIQDSGFRIQNL
jgi:hypothetical protein